MKKQTQLNDNFQFKLAHYFETEYSIMKFSVIQENA